MTEDPPSHGAVPVGDDRWRFRVWAPGSDGVTLHLLEPEDRMVPLERRERGYHETVVDGLPPGARYRYRLGEDGEALADAASRSQPEGVHGPSATVDLRRFPWTDGAWRGIPLDRYVILELHVGTFTQAGTFDGVIEHLEELRDLGITAIELMPVAQFPGGRNWGYDGVFPYAAQDTYGGPEGMMRLVDAAHATGLAVVLDVVYNHLGPEGAVHQRYGPYFTDRFATPWGQGVNVDGAGSDEVRRYFIDNALMWLTEFHVDALRLDAVHGILDMSPYPFLAELADAVAERANALGRPLYLIAESDTNDRRMVTPRDRDGLGMDAAWADDFHHAVHTLVTGERAGYYADFGTIDRLATVLQDGWAFQGEYSVYADKRRGTSAAGLSAERFVICIQNHDQIGNRALGERIDRLCSFEQRKLATGAMLTAPFVPMLFMGEEYGEDAPFLYFVSHTDPDLIEAVRRGRAQEFAAFDWSDDVPDAQDEKTFLRCVLDRSQRADGRHRILYELYRELLRLRRDHRALGTGGKENVSVEQDASSSILTMRRHAGVDEVLVLFNFDTAAARVPLPGATPTVLFDSADPRWDGPGGFALESGHVHVPGHSFAVLEVTR